MLESVIGGLVVGGLVYGAAQLLNAFAFNKFPAARWAASLLTCAALVASFFGIFFWSVLVHGGRAKPDFFFPLLLAWLFYATVNKRGGKSLASKDSPATESPSPRTPQVGHPDPKPELRVFDDERKE
jgi:hypothetical protein